VQDRRHSKRILMYRTIVSMVFMAKILGPLLHYFLAFVLLILRGPIPTCLTFPFCIDVVEETFMIFVLWVHNFFIFTEG
jgi:hypothetical protein